MSSKIVCPNCGNPKKPWFEFCWDCSEKKKQKPICEVCGEEVLEGHTLCKKHWKEKQEEKKKLRQIDYVKDTKEKEFHERYQGKYLFNQIMFKSKSELIIYLFLRQNGLQALYEETMNFVDGSCYHPDFVIAKGEDTIILEHFGKDDKQYNNMVAEKKKKYEKLCKEHQNFYFVWTIEDDLGNLKVKLGEKLNKTPLKKIMWK